MTCLLAQLLRRHYRCGRCWVRFPGRSNRTHCRNRCDVSLELCSPGAKPRRWIRYTLRRNTASIMKIWFCCISIKWNYLRCELNLWDLEREVTHPLNLSLVDTPGTLRTLVTVHSVEAPEIPVTRYDLSEIRLKYVSFVTVNQHFETQVGVTDISRHSIFYSWLNLYL